MQIYIIIIILIIDKFQKLEMLLQKFQSWLHL